jgi:DNA-binding response OmpR family regulator
MTEDIAPTKNPWTVQTILVVDDDPLVVKAMRNLLKIEGFNTLTCVTGAEALDRADENVAAAVVDIHLPDMNGLELSRQLREILPPEVPILILSGDSSMDTIRALPNAGATYFFSKPVNTGMLIGKLKEWTK